MQTQIIHLEDAYGLMDEAVAAAIRNSKPVYISVCCNLAGEIHPSFAGKWLCAGSNVLLPVEVYTQVLLYGRLTIGSPHLSYYGCHNM